MALKLITPPTTYPVSLAEAKAHLRVDHSDEDAMIEIYRKAATEDAENFTGRAFYDQVWDLYLDEFPASGPIAIPRSPLIEVVGVFTRDSAGGEQEWAAASYLVDGITELGRISLPDAGVWPTIEEISNAVRIRFRAGYVDQDVSPESGSVPYSIKAAILLMMASLYQHRETVVIGQTVVVMPLSAERLLRPYRVHTAIA